MATDSTLPQLNKISQNQLTTLQNDENLRGSNLNLLHSNSISSSNIDSSCELIPFLAAKDEITRSCNHETVSIKT